jgi:hypothetical protein
MIDDDQAHEALAMLEEMKRGLLSHMEEVKEQFGAKMRASNESMERRFATIRHEIDVSRRLADMKLPLDQEQLLYSVLTLPNEALGMLREHLGIVHKQGNE